MKLGHHDGLQSMRWRFQNFCCIEEGVRRPRDMETLGGLTMEYVRTLNLTVFSEHRKLSFYKVIGKKLVR